MLQIVCQKFNFRRIIQNNILIEMKMAGTLNAPAIFKELGYLLFERVLLLDFV